jgi:hypothetical protein|tara:strand:+ start:158 stop:385 length:228 start_codon:yes stop_codon:yes gene_type:complete
MSSKTFRATNGLGGSSSKLLCPNANKFHNAPDVNKPGKTLNGKRADWSRNEAEASIVHPVKEIDPKLIDMTRHFT